MSKANGVASRGRERSGALLRGGCFFFAFVGVVLGTSGCAGANAVAARAPVYEFLELDQGDPKKSITALSHMPYVLHFKGGEAIPLSFSLESGLFELAVPPLTVQTKKDIYLLFQQGRPPLLSDDGKNFKQKKHANSFMFGFNIQKDQPTKIEAKLWLRAEEAKK